MSRLSRCARGVALLLVAVALSAAGCSGKGKPSKGNFEKVTKGMSVKEVEELLGPAKDKKEVKELGMAFLMWEEGDTGYMVSFKDGKMEDKKSGSKDEMKKAGGPSLQINPGKNTDDDKPGEGKLTKENAAKVKDGMTRAEIDKLLGPGKVKSGEKDNETIQWGDGIPSVTVTFEKGKATSIQKVFPN